MKDKRKVNPNSLKNLKPIKKGEVRNPNGRPKGSKDALSYDFVASLHKDFLQHGDNAIELVRTTDPASYLRVIASIVPKELTINEGETAIERILDSVSDEELTQFVEGVRLLTVATSRGKGADKETASERPNSVH